MKGFEAYTKSVDPEGSWTRAQVSSAKAIYKAGYEAGLSGRVKETTSMDVVKEIFNYFLEKTGKKHQLSKDRVSIIRARIADGKTPEQLKLVIDYAVSEWLGKRPTREGGFNGHQKTDVSVLFGSDKKIDRYLGLWCDILERRGSMIKAGKVQDTIITRKVDSNNRPSFLQGE